ncbi:MAG: flagellar filament capping protein FliD, partial [Armatimonadetes bacterium]|nr:flagellar filament capping protein FliD [Armatimonadota bacterium]
AKAINDAKAGVTASVIQDTAGYKLMVGSNSTGATYAITFGNALSGGSTTLGTMNNLQAAQDAQIKLGTGGSALTITRASNVITDVIPSVSLALGKAGGPVTVTVSRDTDSMKNAVNAFVSAYNDLSAYITDQTKYDADKKTAGLLLGDGTVRRIQRLLPDIITTATLNSGTVRNMPQMGVSLGTDGKLTVDNTKLNTAVTDYLSDVQSLMATTGSATDPDIAFVSAGSNAVVPTTNYAVSISQAATKGSWTATTRTLGVTDPGVAAAAVTVGTETLTFSGALFPSSKTIDFSLGTTPQQMADAINADANLNGKVYAQIDGTGHLEIVGKTFGTDFTVTSSGVGTGSGYSIAGTNSSQTSSGIPAQVTGTTAGGETLTVDGSTTVIIAAGKTLAQAASDFNAAMVTAGKALRATVSGLALVFERNAYGSGSNTLVSDSASAGALGVGTTTQTIQGQDVDGTINGEAATGTGQILTGDIGNATTEGLVIQVGLSVADLTAQGASQGTVTFKRGAGARLAVEIGALLEEETGAVPGAMQQIEDTIELYDKQIAAWEKRVEQRRATYVRMFTNLERSMGTLRTQSGWLTQQIAGFNRGTNR